MALASLKVIGDAVNSVYNAIADDKTVAGSRQAVAALQTITRFLSERYAPAVDVTLGDAEEADLVAMFAASDLTVALGAIPRAGQVIQVGGTGDSTDNALAAAKAAALNATIAIDITVTDEEDATLAILLASGGEIHDTNGVVLQAGQRFKVKGTGDTTDNALAAAKGGAVADEDVFEVVVAGTSVLYLGNTAVVADGDLFEITNVGTPAVSYLGNVALHPTLFTDNETEDFVSLGA